MFRGISFYIKRDDLIDPLLSGNKYRKLYALINTAPDTFTDIISYGGVQSNAMLSIAALCHQKEWKFNYTTKTLPDHLRNNPTGNLKKALELGMYLNEVSPIDYQDAVNALNTQNSTPKTLVIPQGGADPLAQQGVNVLADEIKNWMAENSLESLNVITPSGTGTTAYYLAQALPNVDVYTTALVGTTEYLKQQMLLLGKLPENLHFIQTQKKYRFGHLYPEYLAIQKELERGGIVFDLLYAPKTWLALLENIPLMTGPVLYVHSGGVSGNETMLERYRYLRVDCL